MNRDESNERHRATDVYVYSFFEKKEAKAIALGSIAPKTDAFFFFISVETELFRINNFSANGEKAF